MAYKYLAYNERGDSFRGTLHVETEQAAERSLWERNLTIVELRHVREGASLASTFPTFLGPKPRDIALFSRQLATLVESGVSVNASLQVLAEQVTNRELGRIIRRIDEEVRTGSSLSYAFSRHPVTFPPLYTRMLEIGERTGNLGMVLRQLASYSDKTQSTSRKIQGAMAYPVFVLCMAGVVILILVKYSLPPMLGLFEDFGAELPWTTRFLLELTDFFGEYGFFVMIGAAILTVIGFIYLTRPAGRRTWHSFVLRIPILGTINIQGTVSKLGWTMSMLLQAGLSLPEVMDLTMQTVSNSILKEGLDQVRMETLQGRGLSEPLSRVPRFPRMLAYMARIGEETGTLDSHLATLAEFYEMEVERAIKSLTSMLEPAMTLVVGLIVGFVAVSVIMPMYSLLASFKR